MIGKKKLTVAALAVIVGGFLGRLALSDSVEGGESQPSNQLSGRSSARSGRERVSREEAVSRLREFLANETGKISSFDRVENLVAHLGDEELVALRDESASARADGPGGWVRCAVHAELARRDPEGALRWLEQSTDPSKYDGWGYRQIWFSTFRGWAEVNPASAFAGFREYASPADRTGRVMEPATIGDHDDYLYFIRSDDTWQLQAVREIFARYAGRDLEAAVAAVPGPGEAGPEILGYQDAIIEGILQGVQDKRTASKLVARWGGGRYAIEIRMPSSPEAETEGVRVLKPDARPGRTSILLQAAGLLERMEPGEGLTWFERNNSGGVTDEGEARAAFYDDFAREFPERALEAPIDNQESREVLWSSLLRHHPERAEEVFSQLDDRSRYRVIQGTILNSSSLELEDLFPGKGQSNRLADWERRYDDLLGMIETGGFDLRDEVEILKQLDEEFAGVLGE